MTTEELHKILDDESRKLSLSELRQVIYELKQDCLNEQLNLTPGTPNYQFYVGEQNGFQLCLDLLEHFDDSKTNDICAVNTCGERRCVMQISATWIVQAVNVIKNGLAQKLEKNGVTVYACGKIIRIDIKESVEVVE